MKMIEFVIPGEPKAKQRPRVTKQGIAYTQKQTIEYENWVKQCYLAHHGQAMLEGEIKATIKAYFGIPKSISQKRKKLMIDGKVRPAKKPDTDNIAKAVLDSLNGIAYKDDSAVVTLEVYKYFDEKPRVEVILCEI